MIENESKEFYEMVKRDTISDVIDDMSIDELKQLLKSQIKNSKSKFVGYDDVETNIELHEVEITVTVGYMM